MKPSENPSISHDIAGKFQSWPSTPGELTGGIRGFLSHKERADRDVEITFMLGNVRICSLPKRIMDAITSTVKSSALHCSKHGEEVVER